MFSVQLDRLGKRLGALALTLVGLLSFLQFLRGEDLVHIALDAIAPAVAAMPEGLPVVSPTTRRSAIRWSSWPPSTVTATGSW